MTEYHPKLRILNIVTLILILAVVGWVVYYTPLEAVMGWVQKLFYFHVASLWVGMLGFLLAAAAGIAYLAARDTKWDILAEASVEISLLFFLAGIISGSIWARPVWNTWWTWDPRLTSAAIVELIYAAYFLLRQSLEEPEKRARFCAVYSIIGFTSVPLTFASIRMLRTIHPILSNTAGTAQAGMALSPAMLQTLLFSIFAFTVLFADLLWQRIRLSRLAEQADHLQHSLSEANDNGGDR